MSDFISLLITVGLIYYIGKFLIKFLIEKVSWVLLDKEAVAERERMRYENTIHAKEFFLMENELKMRGFNSKGIYIFTNLKNKRTYVGQSVNVLRRVQQHLNGRGNKDLHNDFIRGDKFTIRFIKLTDTPFKTLNALERHYISKKNSYYAGYNKTQGNS